MLGLGHKDNAKIFGLGLVDKVKLFVLGLEVQGFVLGLAARGQNLVTQGLEGLVPSCDFL